MIYEIIIKIIPNNNQVIGACDGDRFMEGNFTLCKLFFCAFYYKILITPWWRFLHSLIPNNIRQPTGTHTRNGKCIEELSHFHPSIDEQIISFSYC